MDTIQNIAVIGSGVMGHTIALHCAVHGKTVCLFDPNPDYITQAALNIEAKAAFLAANGIIDPNNWAEVNKRISYTQSLKDISTTQLIFEAIPENADLKKELYKNLESICTEACIIASTTSGLDPDILAKEILFPQRFIIAHFWNPAHLIPLVEVARCANTSEQTFLLTWQLLLGINKTPIEIKRNVPGFIGNRLQAALLREALHLLQIGIASKEDIDTAVTHGMGRRLAITGPLQSADMGGLDTFSSIANYLFNDLSNDHATASMLIDLVKNNKLGVKSGAGIYEWNEEMVSELQRKREKTLVHFMKQDFQE